MNKEKILDQIEGGIIVSCQALKDEPLHGSEVMAKMALAAKMGGARGIRANSVNDILAIKEKVDLPIIGIIKKQYPENPCYITPTMAEVDEIVNRGHPDIIAVDATQRVHPDGMTGKNFIKEIKNKYPDIILMADISILEEGLAAVEAGADMISTTLSGYTAYSPQLPEPDLPLMEKLSKQLSIPVIGEGRLKNTEQVKKAFLFGVHAVVIGSVITRPKEITKMFVSELNKIKKTN